ncbi:MAG: hypothetical protein R6W06_01840 [Prochlorococcaceae cyanobacterium]
MTRQPLLHPLLVLGLLPTLSLLPPTALAQTALAQAPPPQLAVPSKPAESRPAEPTAREKELLERIRQLKSPRWRAFGPCRYDWGGWRLLENGVRTTALECGEPVQKGMVAVHCDTLRMNRRFGEAAWEEWRLPRSQQDSPQQGSEDLMVASLCANARPLPPAAAAPAAKPAAKPAAPAKTKN